MKRASERHIFLRMEAYLREEKKIGISVVRGAGFEPTSVAWLGLPHLTELCYPRTISVFCLCKLRAHKRLACGYERLWVFSYVPNLAKLWRLGIIFVSPKKVLFFCVCSSNYRS